MHNKSYKYRNVIVALALIAVPCTAMAQVEGSALDKMLQRPRVSKIYKNKKAFDHLFVDGGLGINFLGTRNWAHVGPSMEFGFGDWISPEHGFRFNINGGAWKIDNQHMKYLDASLDYMLNITAAATPGTYYTPPKFELIGVAGLEYGWSRNLSIGGHGYGVHIGMRGQFALSKYSYLYAEPRFGLIKDDVTQYENSHGYRPYGNIFVGFGYRLPEERLKGKDDSSRSIADGLFFSVLGGPAFLANNQIGTWGGRFGGRMVGSIGKWFDSYNAVRLSANATSIYQDNAQNNIEAVGLQLDYMANLSNIFGGLNPQRRLWADFVFGISCNASSDQYIGHHYSFGFGGGLQANIRLARGLTLSIEPRVDIYSQRYAPSTNSFDTRDITGALLAGFTYTYSDRRLAGVTDADDIRHSTVTLVAGVTNRLPYLGSKHYYTPLGRLSYARWYHPAFAWRANVQGTLRRPMASGHNSLNAAVGLDWMTDLTALTCGYDVTRPISFKTVAGFNLGLDYEHEGEHYACFSPDIHAGMQMTVRLNNSLHLVAEPQVTYKMTDRESNTYWKRFMPSIAVGVEYSMNRNESKADAVTKPEKKNFVSAGIGTGVYTGNYTSMDYRRDRLTFIGEVGYGHWFNGISGVHASISNMTAQRKHNYQNQNISSLSAGYMMNLKAATLGESTEGDLVQVTGIADLSLVGSKLQDHDYKITWGGKLALQTGFQINKTLELYAEPSVMIYSNNVEPIENTPHPIEGELRLTIGTKFHF